MMLDCLVVGDSIAVGLEHFKPECAYVAKGGWNSWQWNKKFLKEEHYLIEANSVIISLGSNDHKGIKTESELETLRAVTKAKRVYWILPAIKPNIQEIVRRVADKHGDIIVPIPYLQKDGIHPSWNGYKEIKKVLNNDS